MNHDVLVQTLEHAALLCIYECTVLYFIASYMLSYTWLELIENLFHNIIASVLLIYRYIHTYIYIARMLDCVLKRGKIILMRKLNISTCSYTIAICTVHSIYGGYTHRLYIISVYNYV